MSVTINCGGENVSEAYSKGIFVMDYLKSIGLDWGTIGNAICDENLDKSYEIISRNPTITKYEFVEQLGIDYDEEGILMREFLCRLLLYWYHIMEAMDEDNYDKTLEIMETRPDISKEEFLSIMKFTDKYKEEF